jgi:acyl-CoA thioesterase-2
VNLKDILTVRQLTSDVYESRPDGTGFLFGGLTLAVAVAAAAQTVGEGMVPKSLRATFLRPGDWGSATVLTATRTNDGRTFAGRTLTAAQGERTLAIVHASFHRPGTGPDWQVAGPSSVPPPEDCADTPVHLPIGDLILIRSLNPPTTGSIQPTGPHPYWARPIEPVADHCSALTFMSDYLVTLSVLAAVDAIAQPFQIRTIEHSLWFHRPVNTDDWLLFSADPVSLSDGRGLTQGSVRTRSGSLVASFVQEVIIPSD